jgi:hypothetical protein
MNQVQEIMPGVFRIQPDYSKPLPTDEENDRWYQEYMAEIAEAIPHESHIRHCTE